MKPSTFGLTIDQSLRSQRSPFKLFLRWVCQGATLMQEDPGSGPVRVLADGRPIFGFYLRPLAEDAQGGEPFPVTMSLDGDTLVLTVNIPPELMRIPSWFDLAIRILRNEFTWDEQLNKNGSHPNKLAL